MRLDKYLHLNSFTTSRNKASELIISKRVKVNDKIITKPSYKISDEKVTILDDVIYVSRSALKLKTFLINHNIKVKGKKALDIGSSTGGFVQVLCEEGASCVDAVDVGKNQLHSSIKENPKVTSFEEMDIREFKTKIPYEFVTCDVSFVGLSYIIKDIDRLSASEIVILFKPQFEVGKGVKRDKRGVVKDTKATILAFEKFEHLAFELGWKLIVKDYSQVKGKAGNEEILYYFKK